METVDTCPICVEHVATGYRLKCGHSFCTSCIQTWVEHLEENRSPITCPHCRESITGNEIQALLGRSLKVDSNTPDNAPSDPCGEALDEFTRAYLDTIGAQPCPDCGVWIVLEDGCFNIMCRCGCRFCFCCGERGNHHGSTFYNNIAGQEEEREFEWDPETESVAGVVPLFEGDPYKNLDWIEVWESHSIEFWEELEDTYYEREMEEIGIVPLFEGDEWPWYDENNPMEAPAIYFVPVFEFDRNPPWFVKEEEELSRIVPLFTGDWYLEGSIEAAPAGIVALSKILGAAMAPSDEDGVEDYGAGLFL
jgi:Ring finger domain